MVDYNAYYITNFLDDDTIWFHSHSSVEKSLIIKKSGSDCTYHFSFHSNNVKKY